MSGNHHTGEAMSKLGVKTKLSISFITACLPWTASAASFRALESLERFPTAHLAKTASVQQILAFGTLPVATLVVLAVGLAVACLLRHLWQRESLGQAMRVHER